MPPARTTFFVAAIAISAGGCYYTDAGLPPPVEGFYYPTGLVVSPGRNALYVANSNFDLQYNGGTVQAVDLAPIQASMEALLTGISSATVEGWPDLAPLCDATGLSTGTLGLFQPCVTAADCESGACNTSPDGVSKVCDPKPCNASSDCASGLCAIGKPCMSASDCPAHFSCGAGNTCGLDGNAGFCLSAQAVPPKNRPKALNEACTLGNGCLSGHCTIGSDRVNGTCTPCGSDADCYPSRCGCPRDAGGNCVAGSNSPCTLDINNNQILEPSTCTPILPSFQASATIGAFASGAVLALNPDRSARGARLFVPVRGDPSITWFDVNDDRPQCAGDEECPDTAAPHCLTSLGVCGSCGDQDGFPCPKPQVCSPQDHRCRLPCSGDTDCCDTNKTDCTTSSAPVCNNGACVGCLSDYDAAAFASGDPLQLRGKCRREKPFCDTTIGQCTLPLCDPSQPSQVDCTTNPFLLDCGQFSNGTTTGEGQGPPQPLTAGLRCDDEHRLGVDPFDNFRDLNIPVEPVGLDVSADGQAVVSGHNISGGPAAGLSVNPWAPGLWPSYVYSLTGTVAAGPSEVAHIPPPLIVSLPQRSGVCASLAPSAYQPGFVMTFNGAAEADLFRVDYDLGSSPPRPFLTRAGQTAITIEASGQDSRGIAIDHSERSVCEASCGAIAACVCDPHKRTDTSRCPRPTPAQRACLVSCVDIPLRVFIANRSPPSLLLGRIHTTYVNNGSTSDVPAAPGVTAFDTLEIYGSTPLTLGASKVAFGQAIQPDGTPKTYVFAVAFDRRFIFMYDPEADAIVQVIYTGRGPHPIAFDTCTGGPSCPEPHAFLYVGHFTDSYIGVVDLDMRHPSFGTMFASIGAPLPPVESQNQ
jgi:hypothetical protein